MIDRHKVEKAIELLIEGLNIEQTEGTKDTPKRVAKMYEELTSGYDDVAEKHLSRVFDIPICSDIVIEKDIPFSSLCEHHLMPFFGKVTIAYIPNDKVVGISKLARCVETFARRLQVQERMTYQIAEAVKKSLNSSGVFVLVEGEHTCMTSRGVNKIGTKTITTQTLGNINKLEVMQLIQKENSNEGI